LSFVELTELLDIAESEREMFQRRLGAMEREGQLLRNRKGAYILPERASLTPGKMQGHPDGYGFLVPDDGSADIFLDQHQMGKVLHGDRALVRVTGIVDRKGRPEGGIVEVTERVNTRWSAAFSSSMDVVVRGAGEQAHCPGYSGAAREARRSTSRIRAGGDGRDHRAAEQVLAADRQDYVEVLGNYADPGMEIEIALRKHDLPFEFSRAALDENKALPDKVKKADLIGREDLRELPLVTIDGETARDFDDAVFCEKKGRGWRLVVAIADVSHYVKPGMALDKEALERGNSVYFPRRVIPMLPEKLSNGICSLNPDVERMAMVCDMEISAAGKIGKYRFYPGGFPLACPADL
jgi:ribonuclease R